MFSKGRMAEPRTINQKLCISKRFKNLKDAECDVAIQALRDQIFNIPVITDIIFDSLAFPDILAFSIVSKKLISQTREYLGRRRTCIVKCRASLPDVKECVQFLESNNESISPFKFHGAQFVFSEACNCFLETTELTFQIRKMMDLICLKHVSITYAMSLKRKRNDIYEILLKSLPSNEVEALNFTGNQDLRWMRTMFHDGFTNLTSIVVNYSNHSHFCEVYSRLQRLDFEIILSKCPALKELKMVVNIDFADLFYNCGKLSLIKLLLASVSFYYEKNDYRKEMARKMVDSNISLDCLVVKTCGCGVKEFNKWIECMQPCVNNVKKLVLLGDKYTYTYMPIPALTSVREINVLCECEYDYFKAEDEKHYFSRRCIWECYPNIRIITVDYNGRSQTTRRYAYTAHQPWEELL